MSDSPAQPQIFVGGKLLQNSPVAGRKSVDADTGDSNVQVPLAELEEHLANHPVEDEEDDGGGKPEAASPEGQVVDVEAQVVEEDDEDDDDAEAGTPGSAIGTKRTKLQAQKSNAVSFSPARATRSSTPKATSSGKTRARSDTVWEDRFQELLEYKAQNGHVKVPYSRTVGLGQWVRGQRQLYHKGTLNPERYKALNDLGFVWNPKGGPTKADGSQSAGGGGGGLKKTPKKPKSFEERFEMLKAYKEKFGDLYLTQTRAEDDEDRAMINYFSSIRQHYKEGALAAEKVNKLQEIGFDLEKQPPKPKDLPATTRNPRRSRDPSATGQTPPAKRAKTAETPEEPEDDQEEWDENMKKLRAYKKSNGNCDVPGVFKVDPGLSRWVRHVRQQARKGDLKRSRITQLDRMNFDFQLPNGAKPEPKETRNKRPNGNDTEENQKKKGPTPGVAPVAGMPPGTQAGTPYYGWNPYMFHPQYAAAMAAAAAQGRPFVPPNMQQPGKQNQKSPGGQPGQQQQKSPDGQPGQQQQMFPAAPFPSPQQTAALDDVKAQVKGLKSEMEKLRASNRELVRQVEQTKVAWRNSDTQKTQIQDIIREEVKDKDKQIKKQASVLKVQGQQIQQLMEQVQDMRQQQNALQQQQNQIMQQQQESLRQQQQVPQQQDPPQQNQRHQSHLPQPEITNQLQDALHQHMLQQRNSNPYDAGFWR